MTHRGPTSLGSTAPDMQLALDLAVDGRVYLLMGDGSLQTYFSGTMITL